MRTETTYISEDGKKFETEKACREHEENIKRERIIAIQKTMCELDEKIWEKYYPNDNEEESKPELHTAYIWLRNDIVHILADDEIDTTEAEKDILSMIEDTKYHKEILSKYVLMDSIMEEVKIRKDYQSAFSKVESGSDLAHDVSYTFGKSDLKQLARLHKSNKCRRKIEELLTACNFHYECGKFANKDYAEFLE